MLRKLLVVLGFLILSMHVGIAQEVAHTLYDQGKYQEALDTLQKHGLQSATDYYNAGNCLYRLGKTGMALAYYEKANALAPDNADIKYNLGLASDALTKTGSLPLDQSIWNGHIVPIARQISEVFADLLLALVTLGFALMARRLRKTGVTFKRAIVHPGFLLVLGIWALGCAVTTTTVLAHRTSLAAIVADSGVARSGPNNTFTELFRMPAGTTVELTGESQDGWKQIRFSLGNVGWISDKDLLPL